VISWLTTVAPATVSSYSSSEETRYTNQTYTQSGARSANWSQTVTNQDRNFATAFFPAPLSTSGTTYIISNTATRYAETSTTASRTYTYQVTQTESVDTTVWTTGSTGFEELETTVSQLIATSTASVSSSFATTTTNATEADPSVYATIYQADGNEVLWTAASSQASGFSGFSIASAGGSTTRATVYPATATAPCSTFNQTASAEKTNNEVSSHFAYTGSVIDYATKTSVADAQRLPMSTTTFEFPVATTTAAEQDVTVYFGEVLTGHAFKVQTIPVESFKTVSATAFGNVSYTTVASFYSTLPRWTTVPAALSGSTSVSAGTTYTYLSSFGESVSGLEFQEAAMTTNKASPLEARDVWGATGYHDGSSSAAVRYSASVSMQFSDLSFASQSYGISTIFPGTYAFTSGTSQGTATISGLSATYNSGTTKSTFAIIPELAPNTDAVRIQPRVLGGTLGARETVVLNVEPGVYRAYSGTSSSTFSTTGGYQSYAGSTSSTRYLEPLSYFAPAGYLATCGDKLLWTAQRNSTTYPAS